MNIDQIGDFLEHQGLSDEQIDEYFEHHGTKGMKWGVRRAARRGNRALNKASRHKDSQNFEKSVDKAREHFRSGKAKEEWKTAKAQFHQDKVTLGSREAKKILNKTRTKQREQAILSQQAKNGKEVAGILLASFAGALAISVIAK